MTAPKAAAASLGLAALLGSAWLAFGQGQTSGDSPNGTTASPEALAQQIADLRSALASAESERRALAEDVEQLRAELDWLAPLETATEEEEGVGVETSPEFAPREEPVIETEAKRGTRRAGFDEAALLERGLHPDDISRLRERYESSEMDELYLRDRATREEWVFRPRYQRQLLKIRQQLRTEVGDEDYDLMLYASGKDNRVVLTHLLHGSPALESGLRVGDVVQSYDGVRVFSTRDLQRVTAQSSSDRVVPVRVLRDGEEVQIYIPAGPIGSRLATVRQPPSEW